MFAARERADDARLEMLGFEPDRRWVSRNEIGPFSLEMTALVEPAIPDASVLTLVGDTRARGPVRYLLPALGSVFRRRMRASLKRIKDMIEAETPE